MHGEAVGTRQGLVKRADLAFNYLPRQNIHKMITTCVNTVCIQPSTHTHIRAAGGGEKKEKEREALIASVKNLHTGHLCESLLVEMKEAEASKPCVLSVP